MTASTQSDNQPKNTKTRVRPFKWIERWAGYALMRLCQGVVRLSGWKGTAAFGKNLGIALFRISKKYRTIAMKNLAMVFPEMPESARLRITRQMFINFTRTTSEFLYLPYLSNDDIISLVRMEGKEYLDAGLAAGNGVLLVSAHFGNWEYMAARLLCEGYPLDAIARNPELPSTANLLTNIRLNRTVQRLYPKTSIRPALRALKDNRIIGLLADQHDFYGLLVDFLGHAARTPSGPAAMALLTGALIVPAFCVRQPDGDFALQIFPGFHATSSGNREEDIARATQQITAVIGDIVRQYPEQWLWLHDRWRPHAVRKSKR